MAIYYKSFDDKVLLNKDELQEARFNFSLSLEEARFLLHRLYDYHRPLYAPESNKFVVGIGHRLHERLFNDIHFYRQLNGDNTAFMPSSLRKIEKDCDLYNDDLPF